MQQTDLKQKTVKLYARNSDIIFNFFELFILRTHTFNIQSVI